MSTGRVVFYGAPSNYKGGEIAGPPSKIVGGPIILSVHRYFYRSTDKFYRYSDKFLSVHR